MLQGRGAGRPGGYLGPFLAAALMASYVFYGFDTAGYSGRRDRPAAPPSSLGDPPGARRRRARRRSAHVLRHPRGQRPGPARAGPDQRRPAVSGQGRARAQAGCLSAARGDLRRVRLCPGRPRRIGPAHVRDGPRQQPAVRPLARARADRGRRLRSSRRSWSACWPRRSWS